MNANCALPYTASERPNGQNNASVNLRPQVNPTDLIQAAS